MKMKKFFLILCSTFGLNCCLMAQIVSLENTPNDIMDCLAYVGKDTLTTLNECESKCLNYKFQKRRGTFDFSGKKVVFFTGSTGQSRTSKDWYFDQLRRHVNIYGYISLENADVQLVFFSQEEKEQTGCDVAIFIASKMPISKKNAIKRLSK